MDSSLKKWLLEQILLVLSRPVQPTPFILWCDPKQDWKELLQKICGDHVALWAEDCPELLLRHRFATEVSKPGVVWIPVSKSDLTFFKVFEPEADVWEKTLLQSLREFGVEITRAREDEVRDDLLAYALAKLDDPLSTWKTITPEELISAETILSVLTDTGQSLEAHVTPERRHIFRRRVVMDFGFPDPDNMDLDQWRVRVTACLLTTDAAVKLNGDGFLGSEWIIPDGSTRKRSLNLLHRWLRDIQLFPIFQQLVRKADGLINLSHFMSSQGCLASEPLASYQGEMTLFSDEVRRIRQFEQFIELATYISRKQKDYLRHAEGFWGATASTSIPWQNLAQLGRCAEILLENDHVEKNWQTLADAVDWYVKTGWQVDQIGDDLMQDWSGDHPALGVIQQILRAAYLTILDRTNTEVSGFQSQTSRWAEEAGLPYTGDWLQSRLEVDKKESAAVILVDAFRLELGMRLADEINREQSAPVASVFPCRAPVPTTTELGMACSLPGIATTLSVDVHPETGWAVHTDGWTENLAAAESRRKWLNQIYGINPSHLVSVSDAIMPGFTIPKGKRIWFFDSQLDTLGHEGELAISGTRPLLDRYAQLIRKVRDAGYGRIYVTTDHGYIHYEPQHDEVIQNPEGDIRWKTRRAIVGYDLKHAHAVRTRVPGSNLECLTPRSVNTFRAYGGKGFYHRGATLQEWLIPLIWFHWQKKATKTGIVLKPVSEITTMEPVIEIEPETLGQKNLFGEMDSRILGRPVAARIRDAVSGKILFKSGDISVSPKDDIRTIKLEKVAGAEGRYGQKLNLTIIDSDDEEILASAGVILKIEMDDWL